MLAAERYCGNRIWQDPSIELPLAISPARNIDRGIAQRHQIGTRLRPRQPVDPRQAGQALEQCFEAAEIEACCATAF
jgi:hypothetical protein